MIPNTRVPQEQFEKLLDTYENKKYSNKDFRLVGNRIKGYVDNDDALAQAIYFIPVSYTHLTLPTTPYV